MSLVAKHYLISGKVQGVGFRRFLQKRARESKVVGWVRNLSDGRVESCALGSAEAIFAFERFVQRGPQSGEVESCIDSSLPESLISKIKDENDFEVLITGESPCV